MSTQLKELNIFTDRNLILTGEARDDSEVKYDKPQLPQLFAGLFENSPHLIVKTGVVNDKNYGKIDAGFTVMDFWVLLGFLQDVIDRKITQHTMECKGHPWTGQGRSKEALVMTRVTVGRDSDDIIYISVTDFDKARPRIRFKFVPTSYTGWIDHAGQPANASRVSERYAEAWIKTLGSIMPEVQLAEFIDWKQLKEQRDARRNNKGGGNGNSGGNGGGYNNNNRNQQQAKAPAPANDIDDDIPF